MEQWTFQIVRGRGSTSPSSGTCFWTAWLYWAHLFFVIVFSCWTISLDFGLRAGSRKNNQKMTVMKIYLSRRLFLVQARLPIALKFPIALHKDRKMLLLWSIGFSAIFQDMLPSLFSYAGHMRNMETWVNYLNAEVEIFPSEQQHCKTISISKLKETTYAGHLRHMSYAFRVLTEPGSCWTQVLENTC